VGAAGTGIQEVTAIVHREGQGITQAIGTGGRDLSQQIGGLMTEQGLRLLEDDPNTRVIVIVSKPSDPAVQDRLFEHAKKSRKPVIVNFIGAPAGPREGNAIPDSTLEDAALKAVALATGTASRTGPFTLDDRTLNSLVQTERRKLSSTQKFVRGLFTGGSLCYEALALLTLKLGSVYSNSPLTAATALSDAHLSRGHTCLDLGGPEFTQGRPHPMIDPTQRQQRILQEARDPSTAIILLDVVLGLGVHPDPAGALAETIGEARRITAQAQRHLTVIASIIGTDQDPQDLAAQKRKLEAAGVIVMPSNAQAARVAALIASSVGFPQKLDLEGEN
jgi:hypothetical protein